MKNHKAVHKITLQQNPLKDKINLSKRVPLSWATSLHLTGTSAPRGVCDTRGRYGSTRFSIPRGEEKQKKDDFEKYRSQGSLW